MKKIINQKNINNVIDNCEGSVGIDFITSALDYMEVKRESTGLEDIDLSGRYVFASNHPLGALDGLALLDDVSFLWKGSKIVVNDVLIHVDEGMNDLFLPVNKYGKQSQSSSKLMTDSFEGNSQVIFFPAGLCSRKINGKLNDIKWRKTFLTKAIEYKRDIVPVFVDNSNSWLFYFIASFREKLGIKFNLEMILLPREIFNKKNKTIKIYYGKPISYKEIEQNGSISQWVDKIRNESYDLKNKYNGKNY